MKTNHLKTLWKEKKVAIGFWASLGSAEIVENAAALNFDWILIDTEHGMSSYENCLPLLRAMNGSKATSVVRIPGFQDTTPLKRVLDMGAEGVLVPQIKTAEDIVKIVNACRYPPMGERGIGNGRAAKYGLDFNDYFARSNEEIAVIVQIETAEAVENIDSIFEVPGLDAALVGPADLSAALGCTFEWDSPVYTDAVDTILNAAKKANKPIGFFCGTIKDAKLRLEQGFQFVNIADDINLVSRGMVRAFKDLENEKEA